MCHIVAMTTVDAIIPSSASKNISKFIHPDSDHLTLLNIFLAFTKSGKFFCQGLGLNFKFFKQARKISSQLFNLLKPTQK